MLISITNIYLGLDLIAIISTVGTFLSMNIGLYLSHFLNMTFANKIGAFLLMSMGCFMLFQCFHHSTKDNIEQHKINLKETLFLAFSLAINNIGLGIGASITGLPCFETCLATLLISFIFIALSQYIGRICFSQYISHYAPFLSGFLILLLGFIEFCI